MDDVVQRAKESMRLGGPPAPWRVIGQASIQTADGQEMIFESYWDGKPHGWINEWTRQRICDGVNLLPELVAEIEQLRADVRQFKEAIYWALGERGDFPSEPPPLGGKYRRAFHWRRELRRRSGLPIDGRPADSAGAAK